MLIYEQTLYPCCPVLTLKYTPSPFKPCAHPATLLTCRQESKRLVDLAVSVYSSLAQFGTVKNPYTGTTLAELDDLHTQLLASLAKRCTQFNAELVHQVCQWYLAW